MIACLMITYEVSYECYHELRQQEKGLTPMYKVCSSNSILYVYMIVNTSIIATVYIDQTVSRGASHTTY